MAHYDRVEDLPERYREQVRRQDAERAARRGSAEATGTISGARVERHPVQTAPDPAVAGPKVERDGAALRITLPLRAWGVNEERAKHWTQHRRRTRAARDYTQLALADQRLPGFLERVEIEAQSYGTRLDPGSDLPLVKACVDGLVDLGVLAGDSARYVARLILNAPIPEGPDRLVLVVRPAE